ncbi:protein FMC1 homolog [Gasterosteus aculeatus]|uniref:Protein FMC1 homolog n=1 Tax=Gasterosteus aculeatus aculeatus TaxID=481459 RepID=A0AAQ4R3Z6_GASAC|nr:protein FMC1 homolog [Gasterosteus aculeatus aculeatus]
MAALSSPLRVCRGILKELRAIQGPDYKRSLAYNYIMEQFRKNKVTGERYCRAQHESNHDSHTYLCLLASTRTHMALHELYHSKGEHSTKSAAAMVGLRLPTQPGGKGWEK